MASRIRKARLPLALALILALLLAGPALSSAPAEAHAGYERSQPADGATVPEPPERVDVFFGQEVRRTSDLPVLIVVNDSGDTVSLNTVLDDADRTHVYAELAPALPPGRYTVIWHTLSDEDGEEAQGAFHFFVGEAPPVEPPSPEPQTTPTETPPAGATPTPSPTPAPEESEPGDSGDGGGVSGAVVVGIAAAAGAVGLLMGGGAGYVLRRR